MANINLKSRIQLWNDDVETLLNSSIVAKKGEIMIGYGQGDEIADIRVGNDTTFANSKQLNFKRRIDVENFDTTFEVGEASTLFTINSVGGHNAIKIRPSVKTANGFANIGANNLVKHYILLDNSGSEDTATLTIEIIEPELQIEPSDPIEAPTFIYLGDLLFSVKKESYALIEFSIFAVEPDTYDYYVYTKSLYPSIVKPGFFSLDNYPIYANDENWIEENGLYVYTILNENVSESSSVNINIAQDIGDYPFVRVFDGGVSIYALSPSNFTLNLTFLTV